MKNYRVLYWLALFPVMYVLVPMGTVVILGRIWPDSLISSGWVVIVGLLWVGYSLLKILSYKVVIRGNELVEYFWFKEHRRFALENIKEIRKMSFPTESFLWTWLRRNDPYLSYAIKVPYVDLLTMNSADSPVPLFPVSARLVDGLLGTQIKVSVNKSVGCLLSPKMLQQLGITLTFSERIDHVIWKYLAPLFFLCCFIILLIVINFLARPSI